MNWRDENRSRSDYEERERVRGAREVPEPRDTSLHAQAVTEIGRTLPDFHHAPPLRTVPAPPAETPQSKMSIAQLRDRIQGMHATTDLKEREAREDAERKRQRLPILHRAEKPSERRERAEKLTAYSAELAQREEAERQREAERRRVAAEIDAAELKARTAATDAERGAPARSAAQVDPANVPTLVQCNRCNLLVAQDEDGDMQPHLNKEQDACKADPMYWRRPRTNPRHPDQIAALQHDPTPQAETDGARIIAAAAERAEASERIGAALTTRTCNAQGCSSQTYDERGLCSYHRAEYDAATKRSEAQAEADTRAAGGRTVDPIAEAQAKRDARESVECPSCHAAPGERCTNYSGSHCAPHGVRKAPRRICVYDGCTNWTYTREPARALCAQHQPTAQAEPAPVATVTELPPVPAAEKHAALAATRKRRATVAAVKARTEGDLTDLDKAIEMLVREYSSPAVIDAAWSAAKRIFRPLGGRA